MTLAEAKKRCGMDTSGRWNRPHIVNQSGRLVMQPAGEQTCGTDRPPSSIGSEALRGVSQPRKAPSLPSAPVVLRCVCGLMRCCPPGMDPETVLQHGSPIAITEAQWWRYVEHGKSQPNADSNG